MSLKIEDVKVGDALICINKDRFKRKCTTSPIATSENFMVTNVDVYRENIHFEGFLMISASELKYFKKKEQSQYTFDDLIDAVKKASQDGVIKVDSIHFTSELSRSFINDIQKEDSEDFEDHIKFIQSLYKETFVIECEEDLKRVKSNPKITLNNSEVVPFTFKETAKDHLIFYDQVCGHNLIPFVFLKGATVEQERGRDD